MPKILDNNRLLDIIRQTTKQARTTKQKQITRKKQTTRQARIVMKLADIDVLVTFIKVWGSESTS